MKAGTITASVLYLGVTASFLLLASGLVVYFATGETQARPLLELGLIVLLGTPFLRIVILAGEFAQRGEFIFVAIGGGVLLLLIVSIFVGLR